ncbi:SurA N-terminal domain-containing protein [Paraliobacillus salinarum]|uniref:SurA N-terminal domain-containing protein n=1 Tax=Paraliobacillus salinarum TaxID=1158996 RepID=UPI0015F6E263|nr:SurA N-terminal domain-containing protein [Paraliobacillus salinarum]
MFKKLVSMILIILLFTVLVACGDNDDEQEGTANNSSDTQAEEVTVSDDEKIEEGMVVAVINGKEVTGDRYNTVYSQTKTLLYEQGQDVKDQELIKEKALNALVSQEVLSQDVENQGIVVSKQEIDDYINDAKSQFDSEKQFEKELKKLNYTEETFRDQVALQLEQKQYVKESFGKIEVSDQEVESYYKELKKQSDDLPKLEEVKENIKAQLANQQLQNKLNQRIKELKEKAEIEMNI